MSSVTYRVVADGVVLLEIDNPPVNALSAAVRQDLKDAITELSRPDPAVRVLVVTGQPGRFCAGADIAELKDAFDGGEEAIRDLVASVQELFTSIESLPTPTIAAIGGPAVGGGLELALACDFRIVGESFPLGLPEARLGLVPAAGGTQRLPATIGVAAALRMVLLADPVGADEAKRLGLVTEVTPDDDVLNESLELAARLADRPQTALAAAKRAVRASARYDLAAEVDAFVAAAQHPDAVQRVAAFLTRTPR